MGAWEILIIVVAGLAVTSVLGISLYKRLKGKSSSGCGGCCSDCPYVCSKKEEKDIL